MAQWLNGSMAILKKLDKSDFIDFRNVYDNHPMSKHILSLILRIIEDPVEHENYMKIT